MSKEYQVTEEDVLADLGYDIDDFCQKQCLLCNNDWFCPSECTFLEKARKRGYERIKSIYLKHNGDMKKVRQYIRSLNG